MPKKPDPCKVVRHFFRASPGNHSSNAVPVRAGGKSVPMLWDISHTIFGMGCTFNQEWVESPAPQYPNEYWNGCIITRPDGSTEAAHKFVQRITNRKLLTEGITPADPADFEITHTTDRNDDEFVTEGDAPALTTSWWHIREKNTDREWRIEAKLILSLEDVHHILPLLVSFVPPGKTVSLQADSHRAGNCWVGLVCTYDDKRIPFMPISGDIGCGMCMLPLMKNGAQLRTASGRRTGAASADFDADDLSPEELRKLQLRVCYRARNVLARGRVAENGEVTCNLIHEAMTFLGDSSGEGDVATLAKWIDEFNIVLNDLDIPHRKDATFTIDGLTPDQHSVLAFIVGFAMTLGSSGNHFLEMNEGTDGRLYFVVHSGSRGLGAMIYSKIALLCTAIYGTSAVATGEFADLYNRAFSVLNKFAVMNRVLCALAVLHGLGFESNGHVLREYLANKCPLFQGIGAEKPEEVSAILRGVTHNGVKLFVDHSTRRKVYVMCKGAIAISRRASCGIVALRAGEGVYVITLLDENARWVECDLAEVASVESYTTIYDLSDTDVQLMGHGAGRSGSATGTWRKSAYEGMIEYYGNHNIIGNLSPNVLGDNPEFAYKPVEEVIQHLPLGIALSSDLLRTRVNHKEGIDYRPGFKAKFIEFLDTMWEKMSGEQKIMCDLILVKTDCDRRFGKEWWTSKFAEQERLYEELTA